MIKRVRNVPQCLQKPHCFVGSLKQAKRRSVENKVEFLERHCYSESSGNWTFFWTFFFHLCLYRRIFNLEMQNFSLENHHMMNACQPLCWWITFTKVSNPFLASPLNGWHDYWTFVGESGMGDFTDLVWEFFLKPLWSQKFFPRDITV